jgi:hypothetical protein
MRILSLSYSVMGGHTLEDVDSISCAFVLTVVVVVVRSCLVVLIVSLKGRQEVVQSCSSVTVDAELNEILLSMFCETERLRVYIVVFIFLSEKFVGLK